MTPVWHNPRIKGRIPELDGLRGSAILLVLIFHDFAQQISVTPRTWQAYALIPFQLTWSGVDLFFVLSGFLIGGILYEARNSDRYFKTFYFRRIYRIFPIYFFWYGLFLVGLHLVGPDSAKPLQTLFNRDIPIWSYPLFLQNCFISWYRVFGAQWMVITWSLAVEEQFYLILPVLMRHLTYRGIIWLASAAVVVAPIARLILTWSGNDYAGPYTLLIARADALGLGVLIAILCRNKEAWTWLTARRHLLYWVMLTLGGGVLWLATRTRYLYVFVRNPLLAKLGMVSYSVYIFHRGVNELLHFAITGGYPKLTSWASLGITLLSLGITFTLAAISWRVIEKPLIRRAHAKHSYESPEVPGSDLVRSKAVAR
jgi:peptidoglycan/LPS O-acetylase OafA/YrhL